MLLNLLKLSNGLKVVSQTNQKPSKLKMPKVETHKSKTCMESPNLNSFHLSKTTKKVIARTKILLLLTIIKTQNMKRGIKARNCIGVQSKQRNQKLFNNNNPRYLLKSLCSHTAIVF